MIVVSRSTLRLMWFAEMPAETSTDTDLWMVKLRLFPQVQGVH